MRTVKMRAFPLYFVGCAALVAACSDGNVKLPATSGTAGTPSGTAGSSSTAGITGTSGATSSTAGTEAGGSALLPGSRGGLAGAGRFARPAA